MIGDIIAKILAGSAVGYITNYLAIQMLFQEYLKINKKSFKFSLGGVIIKERQEFESQISRLVESDVIHHRAIDAELRKPAFEKALQQIIQDIFEKQLVTALPPSLLLGEVPKIEESFLALKTLLTQTLSAQSNDLISEILHKVALKDILSPTQIAHISAQSSSLLSDFVGQKYDLAPLIENLSYSLEGKSAEHFISPSAAEQISQNIAGHFEGFHEFIKYNYASPLEDLIQSTAQKVDLDTLIQKLAAHTAPRKLETLLRPENLDHLPEAIAVHLRELFQSEVSADIIQTLLRFLLNVFKEEKSTLFELLSDDLKQTFESFLAQKLPDLLATLIPWVRRKKIKLEALIQEAFKENTNPAGRLLITLFIGNVGKYVGIEEKLVDLIEKQDKTALAERASTYLLDYLKNNSIGEIVQRFNEQKILDTLTPILTKNIQESVANLKLDNFNNLFDRPISAFFSEQRIIQTLTQLKDTALNEFVLEKGIFSKKLDDVLQGRIQKGVMQLQHYPFEKILPAEKSSLFAQRLQNTLADFLPRQQAQIAQAIEKQLTGMSQDTNAFALAKGLGLRADTLLIQGLDNFLQAEFERISLDPLHIHLQKVAQLEGINVQLGGTIKDYLLQNLPQIMEGRIADLVSDNLAKQPDTRLRDMVRKAMGEELRPLSFFGGVLGTITGAALLGLPEFGSAGATLAVSGTAYGLTGWGTNWLAIRMLFKPYHPVRLFGTKRVLPFTPGVIAKHKGRFAQSMGRFIGDRLLNQENLQGNFSKNQAQLEKAMNEVLLKNDYAFLNNLLTQHKDSISQDTTEYILRILAQQGDFFDAQIKPLLDKNAAKTLAILDLSAVAKTIETYLQKEETAEQVQSYLQNQAGIWLKTDKNLQDLLSENQSNSLKKQISQWLEKEIKGFSQKMNPAQIWTWVDWKQVEQRSEGFLQNSLAQLLNDAQEDKLKEEVFQFLNSKIQSAELKDRLYQFIDQKLNAEFSPEKNLKDFFGGRMMELLEQNLNNILERVIEMGMTWMKDNKQDIITRVYNDAYKENALAWTFRKPIEGTIDDLVEKGIPGFFEKEFDSLKLEIKTKVDELGNSPLHNTNFIALDNASLKKRIDTILENPKLLRKIKQLSNIILEERIFKIPLEKLLIDDASALMKHLKKVLEPEVQIILEHAKQKLENDESLSTIAQPVLHLVWDIALRYLGKVPLKHFFKHIKETDISLFAERVSDFLLKNPQLDAEKKRIIPSILATLQTQELQEIANWPQLTQDLEKVWKQLQQDESLNQKLKQTIQNTLRESLPHINEALESESKDFVIQAASKAVFKALEGNILDLINSLNFKEIVVREIGNMHAQELEKLFYGFASRYFKYLIGYGFIFGIIFGLAIDAGLLSFLNLF